jgi:2,3-bisphosphoglycerate-independent phosphoglycerate mutase
VAADGGQYKVKDGILADVAPTLLTMMDLPIPAEMTGKNLLIGLQS